VDDVLRVRTADLDGDGDSDVLVCRSDSVQGELMWFESLDQGYSWDEHVISAFQGVSDAWPVDMDSDGDMDVLGCAAGTSSGRIRWWENLNGSGLSWDEHLIESGWGDFRCIGCCDLDDDGDLDVLGCCVSPDRVAWWENLNGSGLSWDRHSITSGYYDPCWMSSVDLDADGDMDVFASSDSVAGIRWWENLNGSGLSWDAHDIGGIGYLASCVSSADVDGDGYVDLLAALPGNDELSWWENLDGSGLSWDRHVIDNSFVGADRIVPEDVDLDGSIDVVGSSSSAGTISWWRNRDGSGTSWREREVDSAFDGVRSVCMADIDGNLSPDVLGASFNLSGVSWWYVVLYETTGDLTSSILDTQGDPQWACLSWSAVENGLSEVYLEHRSSDDPANMGQWSDPVYEPCYLSGALDRYFQYRLNLESDAYDFSPEVLDVTLEWDHTGMGEEEGPDFVYSGPRSNPTGVPVVLGFSARRPCPITLTVFDLSGREIMKLRKYLACGPNEIVLASLPSGVYDTYAQSGDYRQAHRLIVLR
jgi:hypothetical protein